MKIKLSLNKFVKSLEKEIKGKTKLNKDILSEYLDEFYFSLLEDDVDIGLAEALKETIEKELQSLEVVRGEDFKEKIENSIKGFFKKELNFEKYGLELLKNDKDLFKILVFGVNGVGKTLTIAKIAHILKNEFKARPLIAAGDTFRAGSIEQLTKHSEALNVPIIKKSYGADPSSVLYDAETLAKSKGFDYIVADTSGRLPNNENLVRELEKMVRVFEPDLRVLVLDLTQGKDMFYQSEVYNEKIGFDCFVFTKYDVDPKNNLIISLLYNYKKPILFISNGQEYDKYFVPSLEELL